MMNILLAGQAVLDFIFEVETLPSRAEKYRASSAHIVGGGCAANAAVAVARLGGNAYFAGRVGKDHIGDLIRQGLMEEAVDVRNLTEVQEARSSYSSITVDATGERQIVNVRGVNLGDPTNWVLPEQLGAVLADTRWEAGALTALKLAQARGIPSVLDGETPVPDILAQTATHVIFSKQGICGFTGEQDKITALRSAQAKLDAWLAVTDGAEGVHYFNGDEIIHAPAFRVRAVDTLGAGDVWHGAFALALAEGQDEVSAVRFASAAAALKCKQLGGRAGTPGRVDVETFLKDQT